MSNQYTFETRNIINILEEGPPTRNTVNRIIIHLIHLDAEVERLYKTIETARQEAYFSGRNDGIKEFAENAKKNHLAIFNTIYSHTHFCEMIDNLAKEMTEGKDES